VSYARSLHSAAHSTGLGSARLLVRAYRSSADGRALDRPVPIYVRGAIVDDASPLQAVAPLNGHTTTPSSLSADGLVPRSSAGSRTKIELLMRLVPEMVGQLDLERPLDQSLRQLPEHPARTEDLLLGPRAG
jgi:hypothetical protein